MVRGLLRTTVVLFFERRIMIAVILLLVSEDNIVTFLVDFLSPSKEVHFGQIESEVSRLG